MTPLWTRVRIDVARPRVLRLVLDAVVAYLLFAAAHAVFRGSTGVPQVCDSAYSMAAADRLATTGTLDLTSTVPTDPAARRAMPGWQAAEDLPYHLTRRGDPRDPAAPAKVYYGYPLGSIVLSVPWVRHYAGRGLTPLDAAGHLSYPAESELQVRIASRVAAGLVVLLYVVARAALPVWAAALVAAAFAFGSPVWSTLARALWSHTWAAVWLTGAIGLLLAARRVERPAWRSDMVLGVGLGTALFWAVFCRQHTVLSAGAIGLYLTIWHRRLLAFTVLSGSVWVATLVVSCLLLFGTTLPPSVYTTGVIDGRDVCERFFWLMCSPSRGLLVYCPYLVVVGVLLVTCRRTLPDRPLLVPAAVTVAAHTALFSCYNGWYAGYSYGPRYFCDVLPWYVLATVVAVRGLLDETSSAKRRAAAGALAAAFAWGVWVHGRGANSVEVWMWNDRVRVVGDEPAMKEWRHPQFLAGITFEVRPDGSVENLR